MSRMHWRMATRHDTAYRTEHGERSYRVHRASGQWWAHEAGPEGNWVQVGPAYPRFLWALYACARRTGLGNGTHSVDGGWPPEMRAEVA